MACLERTLLHAIPATERSAEQNALTYWADSYDAIICFGEGTPLAIVASP